MPKKKINLKKSEVPTIFPNCPGPGILDGVMKPRYEKDCWSEKEKIMQEAYQKSRINFKKPRLSFDIIHQR